MCDGRPRAPYGAGRTGSGAEEICLRGHPLASRFASIRRRRGGRSRPTPLAFAARARAACADRGGVRDALRRPARPRVELAPAGRRDPPGSVDLDRDVRHPRAVGAPAPGAAAWGLLAGRGAGRRDVDHDREPLPQRGLRVRRLGTSAGSFAGLRRRRGESLVAPDPGPRRRGPARFLGTACPGAAAALADPLARSRRRADDGRLCRGAGAGDRASAQLQAHRQMGDDGDRARRSA